MYYFFNINLFRGIQVVTMDIFATEMQVKF